METYASKICIGGLYTLMSTGRGNYMYKWTLSSVYFCAGEADLLLKQCLKFITEHPKPGYDMQDILINACEMGWEANIYYNKRSEK